MHSILIVDDEQSMREFLSILLKKEGYAVHTASNAREALQQIEERIFSLIISDIKMPGMDGLQLLQKVRKISPDTLVLMITAFGSTDTAIEAMKKGALDYIIKPFKVDKIKMIIRNALKKIDLEQENALLRRELFARNGLDRIIGRSPLMKSVFEIIRKTADSKSNVLITGESGTGKDLVAQAIHRLSRRKDNPFVAINCGALPENLLESELFGYQQGAFTGAMENKKGLFEVADGGSIFLDEIGELEPAMQVKLLRVLQNQEFRRIGGTDDIQVDVRIIAASNQDFNKIVEEKRFREDLYYRLNVIPIEIPSLRERKEDIPLLVNHFLKKVAPDRTLTITEECMERLCRYEWKGNVRELENTIERSVVLSQKDRITTEHLPRHIMEGRILGQSPKVDLPDSGIDFDRIIRDLERDLLTQALTKAGGIKKEAARILNMSFRSFRYKLSKYEIGQQEDPRKEEEVPG
ncbi:MAG: sigma-54-dependent Fis family transcriptional regulator [Deltaproteobacteria bacterium]|nr:sigma-54-dependent Fis family transcriptional regulator [Deltaproteobacteria bacterium]